MVYLSRIYTKTGDRGDTALGDGSRVPKNHPRVVAYGSVDELNSVLGLLLAQPPASREAELLRSIQNDLLDVGADLCVPQTSKDPVRKPLRIQPDQSLRLEQAIDRLNGALPPLTSFVLPGGSLAGAWCHVARTVCRRAERDAVTLAQAESINSQIVIYLNRVSDLLFVLARVFNQGDQEVLWVPGKMQKQNTPSETADDRPHSPD